MRRTSLIILLITLMTILLSGCIQIDISTGVDAELNAFLSYRIELDVNDADPRYQSVIKRALNRIGWHYQEEHGFIVELGIENDDCLLIMTKRIASNDFEQALRTLDNLLKNEEITVFMQVDTAFERSERQSRYVLGVVTDIPQIMRLSNSEELSPALLQMLDDALVNGSGTVSVTFPVSELIHSSHEVNFFYDQATMAVPLSYSERTDLELAGVINYRDDGTRGGTTDEIIQEQTLLRNISFIAAGSVILLLLIILLAVKLKS